MEPDRRLTAQGVERTQQLLDCAAELFAERGYAETRVIDIVRTAGVAKGLFYWYFDNKEALFKELAGRIRLNLRREQGAALDAKATPLVNLYRGTESSVRFMAEHAPFFSLLEVEGRNFTDVMRQGTQQHIQDMVRLVKAGQADGTIREENSMLLALGVVGSVIGFTLFFYLLKHVTANTTALITLITPVLALLLGAAINHEPVSMRIWAGTALVLSGLALHQWGGLIARVIPIRVGSRGQQ